MKKKGLRSVRRNKRRTMQTGGGHTELIKAILSGNLNDVWEHSVTLQPNEKNHEAKSNRTFPYAEGRTALYLACRLVTPNPGIVNLLLDNGFSPNSRNNANLGNGAYPLHGVVQAIKVNIEEEKSIDLAQSLAIIQLLKAKGADLSAKNSHGLTASDEYFKYVYNRLKLVPNNIQKNDDLLSALSLPPPPQPPPPQPVAAAELGPPIPPWGPPPGVLDTRRRPLYAAAVTTPPPPQPPPGQGDGGFAYVRQIRSSPGQVSFGPPPPHPVAAAELGPPIPPWGPQPGVVDPRLAIRSTAAAAAAAVHSPVAATHNMGITIQPTKSLTPGFSLQTATSIEVRNAFVLYPSLVTFQRTIGGNKGGMSLNYNGGVIKLPDNGGDFNGIHLQVLARNESLNVDGIMRTSLYGGNLSVEEIATIRCLVKNTTVVGLTYPEKNGGYPQGKPIVPIPRKPTIIVDQCGLQWQNSIYNTGALFFYPTGLDDNIEIYEGTDQGTKTTLGKYKRWQNATYWEMYGEARPLVNTEADPDATWVIQDVQGAVRTTLVGKLKSPVVGFTTEFMQAFHSVHFMAKRKRTPDIKTVHFKFLRAGLGFFSENILLTGDRMGIGANGLTLAPKRTKFLETARLQGICDGIRKLGGAPDIMARTKIKKIILPFQTFTIPDMNSFGAFLVSSPEDALAQHPHSDVTIATTNCADPHAGPGNEGGYHSVDAAIASNTYVHHLNAAYNYANIQSALFLFEEFGPVVSPPHYIPAAAHGSAQYVPPGGAAVVAYSPPGVVAAMSQDIRVHARAGSHLWATALQNVKDLWPRYLDDPTGMTLGWNHEHPTDHIMINHNTNKLMLRQWDPTERITLEKGIMDVNDIKVYLIGPSLPPQQHGKPPMEPGWYPARNYQKFAYLDFMYNNDESELTYYASKQTEEDLRTKPQYRAIKGFDATTFNSPYDGKPIIFTMRRIPNGGICYHKNDAGRTQVMISGISMEREAYTREVAARLARLPAEVQSARRMWRDRPPPPPPPPPPVSPALPGAPLPLLPLPLPMAVAAPMAVAVPRTPYQGPAPPRTGPRFPIGLMADVDANDDDNSCVICMTSISNLKFKPCDHCICCISCYIENPNRSICPSCRARVTSLALCDEGGAEYQPGSPRGQRGCVDGICNWAVDRHPKWSRAFGITRRPGGGRNKNRKQQKQQKQQKQRATRKHKNKKQSRRRGQRQPRHSHGSRRAS